MAIVNTITTKLCGKSLHWHTITHTGVNVAQGYVVIPLATATSNLFTQVLSLGSLLLFEINTLVCLGIAYSYMVTRHVRMLYQSDCSIRMFQISNRP